jgi:D-alanyl-D-alanine carboxypeptidase
MKKVALALALVVVPHAAQADDLTSFVATSARANLQQTGAPSVSIGIMQHGTIELTQAFGSSRLTPDVAAASNTTYDVGSVTKQFIAAAILLLQEEHKLSVTDPVSKYIPVAASAGAVTIRNLLNQTSGYVDYYPLDYVDREMSRPASADAIIREYATLPLEFAPGTTYSYSNTNYTLLGKIVEIASGLPFANFLSARFFTPLGMTHTYCDSPSRVDPDHAYGYTSFFLGPLVRATPEADGWIGAAGCLATTPEDLLKWDAALTSDRVLNASSYAAMIAPTVLTDGKTDDYGYGITSGSWRGHKYIAHDGGLSGFSALNISFPSDGTALAIVYNRDNVSLGPLARTILVHLYAGGPAPATPTPTPAPTVQPQAQPTMSPGDAAAAQRVRTMIVALQKGKVDRATLSADYNAFLTPELARRASENLSKLGPPLSIEASVSQNHGQELTVANIRFSSRSAVATMRRTADGKVAQFLVNPT